MWSNPSRSADEDQARLTKHLALARELGAEVVATADADIARGLLRVAQQQNATQIIVGKPGGGRLLDRWRGARLLRRLVRDSGHIDLHVVRPEASETAKTARRGRVVGLEYFAAPAISGRPGHGRRLHRRERGSGSGAQG